MKKKRRVIGTGISLIVLIFVIVSLVTFAALAMTSAQADYKLSKKLADRTTDYNKACKQSNQILEQIDACLASWYEEAANENEYYGKLSERLELGDTASVEIDESRITWENPVGEEQILCTVIMAQYPDGEGEPFYEMLECKVISDSSWEKEDRIPVLNKDELPNYREKE